MNPWKREILAILRKEWITESRSKSGMITVGLFSFVSVVAVGLSTFGVGDGEVPHPLAAGMLWIVLLFSSMVALPRVFVAEEEQGTGDLLRLVARPHSVFWGKMLYNLALTLITGAVISFLFFGFVRLTLTHPLIYLVCLIGGCMALAGAVTLCGALVAQAANRWALAGAIGLPLLIPPMFLVVQGIRTTMATVPGSEALGYQAGGALVLYGIASMAVGPYLFAAVWKN